MEVRFRKFRECREFREFREFRGLRVFREFGEFREFRVFRVQDLLCYFAVPNSSADPTSSHVASSSSQDHFSTPRMSHKPMLPCEPERNPKP